MQRCGLDAGWRGSALSCLASANGFVVLGAAGSGMPGLIESSRFQLIAMFKDILEVLYPLHRAVALKFSSQAPTAVLDSIHTTDLSMNSVFPDRFWSQNPVQQDPQNRSIDETWNTKTSNLERPLPPLPVSTHSRDNSANEDPFSSPLEQFYRQHSSQYQQKLNQSQQSFSTKPSLSNATSVDSFSFEKGQGRAGLKARRTRLEALVDSFSPYFSDWWLGEILCWVAGTLCIGAIILVLALYDGQPVPSRWPLGITLNAFISVISAVGKFSLAVPVNECIGELKWIWYGRRTSSTQSNDQDPRLTDFETFDQASRGPWGAVLLAARLRTRYLGLRQSTWAITLIIWKDDRVDRCDYNNPHPCTRPFLSTSSHLSAASETEWQKFGGKNCFLRPSPLPLSSERY